MLKQMKCPQCGDRFEYDLQPGEKFRVQCDCGHAYTVALRANPNDSVALSPLASSASLTRTPPSASSAASSEKPSGKQAEAAKQEKAPSAAKSKDSVRRAAPKGIVGQELGGCLIEKKIGQGGMGIVYKGRHLTLDAPVAIKVLPPQFARQTPNAIERFIQEARSAAKLQHQNIVGALNVGQEKGLYFIVMPFVGAGSIRDRLKRDGRIPEREAINMIRQVAEGLAYAHENNVIHRDIKPDNILLDEKGTPKLSDLGLAKQTDDDAGLTQSQTAMGTPYYISPEQAHDSKNADGRSDIYSLGCTLFHMACGRVPYDGPSSFAIMSSHMNDKVPSIRSIAPGCTEALDIVLQKMMAKKASQRYQSAREVVIALEDIETAANLILLDNPRKGSAGRKKSVRISGGRPAGATAGGAGGELHSALNEALYWLTSPKGIPLLCVAGVLVLLGIIAAFRTDSAESAPPADAQKTHASKKEPAPEEAAPKELAAAKTEADEQPAPKPTEKEEPVAKVAPEDLPTSTQVEGQPDSTQAQAPDQASDTTSEPDASSASQPFTVYKEWPFGSIEASRRQRETAKQLNIPETRTITLSVGKKMEFILIPAGEFMMGDPEDSARHTVRITKPFYMAKYECTQEQYEALTGKNPSHFKWSRMPVEQVSWNNIHTHVLPRLQRLAPPGMKFRLPTEAEWEYVCRSGTDTRFNFGDEEEKLFSYGNYCDQSHPSDFKWKDTLRSDGNGGTAYVGSYRANAWGVYDMHGNVWEYCEDFYHEEYFTKSEIADPVDMRRSDERVLRGGCWNARPSVCRSSSRFGFKPSSRSNDVGFRLCLTFAEPQEQAPTPPPMALAPIRVTTAPAPSTTQQTSQPAQPQQRPMIGPLSMQEREQLMRMSPPERSAWFRERMMRMRQQTASGATSSTPTSSNTASPNTPSSNRPAKSYLIYRTWPFDSAEAKRRQEETASMLGLPITKSLALPGGATMTFVLIPAGEFMMGSPATDQEAYAREKPQHKVQISQPFYLSKYECTQAEWIALTNTNPSKYKGLARLPVEQVSYDDITEKFLPMLQRFAPAGTTFRLPTEAQWEYACRAGSAGNYCFGSDSQEAGKYAWTASNAGMATHEVGQKMPNAWMLCDMHGNVGELCLDWRGTYPDSAQKDPLNKVPSGLRALRGGCVGFYAQDCRSASRDYRDSSDSNGTYGFRLVQTINLQQ